MDYKKVYDNIIERGLVRFNSIYTYCEVHHITPKCMGGSEDDSNKVRLTYREHFLAHWLLHLIYPNDSKLEYAFMVMAYGKGIKLTRFTPSSKILLEKKLLSRIKPRKKRKNKKKEYTTEQMLAESLAQYLLFSVSLT